MFDIKILRYSFYHEYVDNIYPVVEMEAVYGDYEDDFLCMPIKFKRIYDAYDFVYNKLDGTLDDMIKDFVDELWKEFHKGIPRVYEVSLYISLPVGLNMWIKEHIRNEIEERLDIKYEEDKICRALSNSRFGIISHDMRHMYSVPNRDICTLYPEPSPVRQTLRQTFIDETLLDIYPKADVKFVEEMFKDRAKAKEKIKEYEMKKIEKVIFNDPATIVFWRDGSKTVVKAKDEPFDKEKGLAMAIAKNVYGNEGNYYNIFRKWCKEE